nr:3622_t:CDS:2 [Entrophospora candida]
MTHQAWTIADLPHRRWRLKYLPDEFRAEDVRDENHPYFTLLKIFDQLRDLAYTTEDVPMLSIIEHKLKIVGKIIDNLIDLPGPYIKGVIDFTALSAYVHTINDLWSKKNQLMLTPVWRSHITSEKFSEYLNTEVYESFLLPTLYHISLILDWWLGDPQFEFWIGIIDLNFDQFETQLEAYVHFYNAECIHDTDSSATTPSSMKSDETTDEELNDNDTIFKPLVHTDSSDFEWSDSDF